MLEPLKTIRHPASLLYFDGGDSGRWIASLAAGLYIVFRVWKDSLSWKAAAEMATVFWLGGGAAYHAAVIWFESDNWPFHAGYALLALMGLLSFFMTKQPLSLKGILQRWQWLSISLAFLWFLNPERVPLILSFSFQQAAGFATGVLLTAYLWRSYGQ